MPRYDVSCPACGVSEVLATSETLDFKCPVCGGVAAKQFPLSNFRPLHAAEKHAGDPHYEKWFNSDETQRRLKSGDLTLAKGDSERQEIRAGGYDSSGRCISDPGSANKPNSAEINRRVEELHRQANALGYRP